MKSWTNVFAVLTLSVGVCALGGAVYVFTRGFDPTTGFDLDEPPVASVAAPTPLARESDVGRASVTAPRPDGLRELNVVAPGDVLLAEQRPGLLKHLAQVKLTLNVPDAMSYRGRREGQLMVLSGASGPGTGFFLFSERGGKRLRTDPKHFLREYLKGSIEPRFDERDQTFLSRYAGQMTWIRGEAAGGQRFDAYLIPGPQKGFAHLLFIYDPTVANATRRLMVDSVRPRR